MKANLGSLLLVGAVSTFALCDLCGGSSANARTTQGTATARVPAHVAAQSSARQAPVDSTVTLDVAGMTCGGCVLGVRKVLARLDGVSRATVTYEPPRAVVTFDPARASVERIVAAIWTLGYTAHLSTQPSAQPPRAGVQVRP